MVMWTAQNLGVQHSWHRNILNKPGTAGHFVDGIRAPVISANDRPIALRKLPLFSL